MEHNKRFWLTNIEYDGEQRFVRDNDLVGEKSMSNWEVVDALNDFSEEIEELKKGNNNLKESRRELIETINYYNKVIGGLTEENEQLRMQLDDLLSVKKEILYLILIILNYYVRSLEE